MSQFALSDEDRKRLIGLTRLAVANFNAGDWQALGVHTGALSVITDHERLLRSLSFNDPDYSGNAHGVMFALVERDIKNLRIIEEYISEIYGSSDEFVSNPSGGSRTISFSPSVFQVPDGGVEKDLVSVMTPFSPEFEFVFEEIKTCCSEFGLRALRAKDIWDNSSVIQDVFSLIFRSRIVVCDFTGKNANVFYEAGIAHTLGKHVVPITQVATDIPFDLQHHRYLHYLNNAEGRLNLRSGLANRFRSLR